MKKIFWWSLAGILLALQLFRPNLSNPPVNPAEDLQQTANPPAAVMTALRTSCYDCHSNETQYPWYSQVAPVSWMVANNVREGREKLNFSTFGRLSAADRFEALGEAAEAVQEGEMPVREYVWLHPAAELTADNRTLLLNWLQANGGERQRENTGQPAVSGDGEDEHEDD